MLAKYQRHPFISKKTCVQVFLLFENKIIKIICLNYNKVKFNVPQDTLFFVLYLINPNNFFFLQIAPCTALFDFKRHKI